MTIAARSATEVFSPQLRWASAAAAIAACRSSSEISGYSLTVSPVAGLMTAYLPILVSSCTAVAWRFSLIACFYTQATRCAWLDVSPPPG